MNKSSPYHLITVGDSERQPPEYMKQLVQLRHQLHRAANYVFCKKRTTLNIFCELRHFPCVSDFGCGHDIIEAVLAVLKASNLTFIPAYGHCLPTLKPASFVSFKSSPRDASRIGYGFPEIMPLVAPFLVQPTLSLSDAVV